MKIETELLEHMTSLGFESPEITIKHDMVVFKYLANQIPCKFIFHRMESGYWVRAYWNDEAKHWHSTDLDWEFKTTNPDECYVFGGTLKEISGKLSRYNDLHDAALSLA